MGLYTIPTADLFDAFAQTLGTGYIMFFIPNKLSLETRKNVQIRSVREDGTRKVSKGLNIK